MHFYSNSLDDAVIRGHTEVTHDQMQSDKIIALEKGIVETKEELYVTGNINSTLKNEIRQQSHLLSIEGIEKQSMNHESTDKIRTINNLQVKLNNMNDIMDQLKLEFANNENTLMNNMIVKDEALTKLKQDELATKQNSLDDLSITIQRHSSELEYWQKESQENMHKIFTLEQAIIEKGEEFVTTRSELSNLHSQLIQQSDQLSGIMTSYANKERAMQNELDDKNTNIDNLHADNILLKAELDDAKHLMQQLKLQHSMELAEWQKERLGLSEKTMCLNKDLVEKKEELVIARQEISDLNNQLAEQSDHLSGMMKRYSDKERALQNELDDKNTSTDDVHANNVLLKAELDDVKHVMQHLKLQHSKELEEWQKDRLELLEKTMHLNKELVEKEEELVVARQEMSDLNNQLAQQSDHLNGIMTSYADKERALQKELDDKNTNIDNLHADNVLLKVELDDGKHAMQQLKLQHSMELEEWQKERLELLEKAMHLNKDLVEKEEELVVARQKMSDLNNQLAQQSDHLNGIMTSYADKERALQNDLDDKNYNIDDLQADIVMLKAELNDAKYSVQQLKLKSLSVKQELATKEMMTKAKDEALAEREELITEQNGTISKYSIELEELQKECRVLSEKTMHLNNDLIEKKEELVVARQEISDLNNQLAQQSYQPNTETVDNTLADRKSINWRIIDKLELDNEMFKAKLHDAEELIEQLKMQHLTLKEQPTKDDEEKKAESKHPIEANNDGDSSVESKENKNSLPKQHADITLLQDTTNKAESDDDEKIVESKHQIEASNDEAPTLEKNQNSLPKQHADTRALPQEGVNKVESDDDEKIVESKCQIEANNDGASALEKIENQNSLPKQNFETLVLSQEAVNKVESDDDDEKIVESKCQIEANNDAAFSVHMESKENQNSLPQQHAELTALPQEGIYKVESDDDDEKIVESKCQIEANNDGASALGKKENQNSLQKQNGETVALSQEAVNKVESDDDEKIVETKCQIEANNDAASSVHVESKENQNSLPKQHAETTVLPQERINKVESDDNVKIVESKCQIEANNDGASALRKIENQNSLPKQHAETTVLPQERINKVESDDDVKIVESKFQIEANNDGASALRKIENQNSLPNRHAETAAVPQETTNKVERPDCSYISIISDSCKEVSH